MTDQEIVKVLAEENEQFKKIADEHRSLEKQLEKLRSKSRLTNEEDTEKKNIKKLKLKKKDQMAMLVMEYRKNMSLN